ncbi:MAG: response regulator [Deltaproteobacteria bacterium]|nr:response regulator [Deltaproteobacteria bacterium]
MGLKVLLIDDEQDLTELLKTLLEFHDVETDSCNNSSRAEEILAATPYRLIVTDLMMPDIDGFELIRRIRRHPRYQETPVIALSAKTLTDEERKFLLQNHVRFLAKPFEPQNLAEQISQLLR